MQRQLSERWRRSRWVPSLGAIAVAYAVQTIAWRFHCDDAFISFRYADNLVAHGVLHFNVGEAVEGYTNLAWVLLIAAAIRLGVAAPTAASCLTVASGVAAIGLAIGLASTLRSRFGSDRSTGLHGVDLAPAALLVASPEFMVWTQGGLETLFASTWTLVAFLAWLRGRWSRAAIAAALAWFSRPDTAIAIAAFGLAWIGVVGLPHLCHHGWKAWRDVPWRSLAVAGLIFAFPVALHMIWRHQTYGAWWPNTWAIKQPGQLLRSTYGRDYVIAWLAATHAWILTPLLVAVRPRHLLLVVPIVAILGYGWSVGGDFMAYSRFYSTATVLLAILVVWLLTDACGQLERYPAMTTAARWLPGVAWILALALGGQAMSRWREDRAHPSGWLDGRWEGVTAMDRFAAVGVAVGTWMREHLPPNTFISVGAAGAVPFAARLPTLDAYGLVDPVIAKLPGAGPYTGPRVRPGHQFQAPTFYVKARDPDLLCHVGYRGPRPPGRTDTAAAFRDGYTWACIRPGPISAAGTTFDPGYYCCRRRLDRIVGPFGAP